MPGSLSTYFVDSSFRAKGSARAAMLRPAPLLVSFLLLSMAPGIISAAAISRALTRHPLRDAASRQAVCLDGNTPQYFFRAGTTQPDKLVIYFMHGGFCGRSLAECAHSIAYYSPLSLPTEIDGYLLLSPDATENPYFHGWSKVLLDYCTGDGYSLNGTDTYLATNADGSTTSTQLHFRGANIVKFLVDDLKHGYLFNPAQTAPSTQTLTDILLAGSSAGGLGVMGHAWRFQAEFPTANIRGLIDSSQFFSIGGEAGLMAFLNQYTIASGTGCQNDPAGPRCCFYAFCMAQKSGYYNVPTLWVQSKYDFYSTASEVTYAAQSAGAASMMPGDSPAISHFLHWMAVAGRVETLSQQVVSTHAGSAAVLSTCAEHVLFAPTTLKNQFFGYDYAEDRGPAATNSAGVYSAKKLISLGVIENPVSTSSDINLQVSLNAGLLRASNVIAGNGIMHHVTAWANGNHDGEVIQRTSFAFNSADESCQSEMKMDFTGMGNSHTKSVFAVLDETVFPILVLASMVAILGMAKWFWVQRLRLRLLAKVHMLVVAKAAGEKAGKGGGGASAEEDARDAEVRANQEFAQKVLQQRRERNQPSQWDHFLSAVKAKGAKKLDEQGNPVPPTSPREFKILLSPEFAVTPPGSPLFPDGVDEAPKTKPNRKLREKVLKALQKEAEKEKERLRRGFELDSDGAVVPTKLDMVRIDEDRPTLLSTSPDRGGEAKKNSSVENGATPAPEEEEQEEQFLENLPCMMLQNVTYQIGSSHMLLVNVNCVFRYGRMIALMGGSGSGKSTLCKLASDRQVEGHYSGLITLDGVPMDNIANRTAKIAYVRQFPGCGPDECTVIEALLLHAYITATCKYKAGLDIFQGLPTGDALRVAAGAKNKAAQEKYSKENVEELRRIYEQGTPSMSTTCASSSSEQGGRGVAPWTALAKLVKTKTSKQKKEADAAGQYAGGPGTASANCRSGSKTSTASQRSRKTLFAKLQSIVKDLNMGWFLHRRIKDLSGGQKKLLSVAQALICEPGIIFLDEPTSGLDAMTAETLMLALSNVTFKQKCCMVVVIHQPSPLVYSLFDDLVLLCRGKVIYSGPRELADESLDALDRKLKIRHGEEVDPVVASDVDKDELKTPVKGGCATANYTVEELQTGAIATNNSDATLAKAMSMFGAGNRKWDMIKHAVFVPRAPSAEEFIGQELKESFDNKKKSQIKRAIDGADPAPGKSALLLELFAYNELTLAGTLPLVMLPAGAVVVWGFLEYSSAKHDAAKCMLEVYVVGFAVLNILLPNVFSHLHSNKDCLQDRIFRSADMFWVIAFFSQLLAVVISIVMGTLSLTAYLLPSHTMKNCGLFEHIAVCYLFASFISLTVQLLMYRARGHEDSACMAAVFTQLAVFTAALSLFSGFTITLEEAGWLTALIYVSPPFWAQKKLVVVGFLNEQYGCANSDCLLNSGNAWIAMLYGGPDGHEYTYVVLFGFCLFTLACCRLAWWWKMGTPAVKVLVPKKGEQLKSIALFPFVSTSSFSGLLDRVRKQVEKEEGRSDAEGTLGEIEMAGGRVGENEEKSVETVAGGSASGVGAGVSGEGALFV